MVLLLRRDLEDTAVIGSQRPPTLCKQGIVLPFLHQRFLVGKAPPQPAELPIEFFLIIPAFFDLSIVFIKNYFTRRNTGISSSGAGTVTKPPPSCTLPS